MARLAGLPPAVVARAAEVSATWDSDGTEQQQQQQQQEQQQKEAAEAMEVDGGVGAQEGGTEEQEGGLRVQLQEVVRAVRECVGKGGAGGAGAGEGAEVRVARLRELQGRAAALVGAVGA